MKLTHSQFTALTRLKDFNARYGMAAKTIFIGRSAAAIIRTQLVPRGYAMLEKRNNGYRYSITEKGRATITAKEAKDA